MNVLITGGLGNLGLWLTNHFLNQGFNVTALGRRERVKINHKNFEFLCVDITSSESLYESISCYYDACIHTASFNENLNDRYSEDALKINALGTEYLCKALNRHGVGRLIYLSTFHVYGLKEGSVSEKSEVSPDNDYALTHYFAEKYIEKNAKISGLEYTVFRLSNSYGCPKDIKSDKWYLVLNDLCLQAHKYKGITLKSNGSALRDFVWMQDVAEVLSESLKYEALKNDTFNLSSRRTLSILEVAEYVKLAYFELYQESLAISLNPSDKTTPLGLDVSNAKLNEILNFSFRDRFKEEALKILAMLGDYRG